ncbi:hypothetical protein L9F63_019774, partial [Diploptera punctata]
LTQVNEISVLKIKKFASPDMKKVIVATGGTPQQQNPIFAAASMDSSIAITTLIIMGIIILLLIQVGATLATMRMCKDDKFCSFSSVLILCIPFIVIITGTIFLLRKSPSMPLT